MTDKCPTCRQEVSLHDFSGRPVRAGQTGTIYVGAAAVREREEILKEINSFSTEISRQNKVLFKLIINIIRARGEPRKRG